MPLNKGTKPKPIIHMQKTIGYTRLSLKYDDILSAVFDFWLYNLFTTALCRYRVYPWRPTGKVRPIAETSMKESCELQGRLGLQKNLIWPCSMRVSWSAYELFYFIIRIWSVDIITYYAIFLSWLSLGRPYSFYSIWIFLLWIP